MAGQNGALVRSGGQNDSEISVLGKLVDTREAHLQKGGGIMIPAGNFLGSRCLQDIQG